MTARQPAPTTLRFGVQLTPTTDLPGRLETTHAAEEGGLDLIGLQDHPSIPDLADTLALVATLAAHTHRIAYFPDVATLPLRPPGHAGQGHRQPGPADRRAHRAGSGRRRLLVSHHPHGRGPPQPRPDRRHTG